MIRFLAGLILGASAATYLIAVLLTSSRETTTTAGGRSYGFQVNPELVQGTWT
jgi:hypothetical protein